MSPNKQWHSIISFCCLRQFSVKKICQNHRIAFFNIHQRGWWYINGILQRNVISDATDSNYDMLFISHCSSGKPSLRYDWHFDGVYGSGAKKLILAGWWIYYLQWNPWKMNLCACENEKPTSFQPLQKFSSADETVHIFNCTKIPLKFALNKLSETNGISNPTHRSWHCNSFDRERETTSFENTKTANFHFKRFLSYLHLELEDCCCLMPQ